MLNQAVTQHLVKSGLNKFHDNCFLIGGIKNK